MVQMDKCNSAIRVHRNTQINHFGFVERLLSHAFWKIHEYAKLNEISMEEEMMLQGFRGWFSKCSFFIFMILFFATSDQLWLVYLQN